MSAKADILTNKHDILKEKGSISDAMLVDHLFDNFMQYISAHWHYHATPPNQNPIDLLGGSGAKTVNCDNLSAVFAALIRDIDDKLKPAKASKNWFISKPALKNFDAKVTGNMGNPDATSFNLGCHFSAHYFVNFNGKYYDPCLSTTYNSETGAVFMETRLVPGTNNLRYAGTGNAIILLKPKQKVINGFGGVFEVLSIAKGDPKKRLDKKEYEAASKVPALKAAGLK
jgi:hypothetical protein